MKESYVRRTYVEDDKKLQAKKKEEEAKIKLPDVPLCLLFYMIIDASRRVKKMTEKKKPTFLVHRA